MLCWHRHRQRSSYQLYPRALHACTHTVTGWKKTLAASNYEMDAGPLDPECTKNGGVAVLTTSPFQAIPYIPKCSNYSKAYDMGRIAAHWIQCDTEQVLCWNMYGWTGGGTTVIDTDKSNEAAQRTDDLVCIMKEETIAQGDVPAMCCVDLNATTADIPTMHTMIEEESWIDCGAKASIWGGINCQYTCQANKLSAQSRIDHIFVNARLFPAVKGFQVDYCDSFHTHQPLQLRLQAGEIRAKVTKARKTISASKLFEDMVDKEFANNPEVGEQTTRNNILSRLHSRMDIALGHKIHKLRQADRKGDTDAIWQTISSIADKSFSDHFELEGKDRKAMTGRGKFTTAKQHKYIRRWESTRSYH